MGGVFVAGHRGMVGSALVRRLRATGVEPLCVERAALDLRRQDAVEAWMKAHRPETMFVAAAKVGGILANASFPADFLHDNLAIQTNLIHAAHLAGVDRLVFLGSSCIYPQLAPQPIREDEPADRPAGADQRSLRDRQDRRRQDVRGLSASARAPLHLGHADQPLRPNDNFDLADQPRPAGADPQGRTRRRLRARRASPSGARGRRCANSCTSTISRAPRCSARKITTTRRRSTAAQVRRSRSPSSRNSSAASSATKGG